MTFYSVIVTPIIFGAAFIYFLKVKTIFKKVEEAEAKMTTTLQERVTGIRVVKAFAKEKYEIEKFDRHSKEYLKEDYKLFSSHDFQGTNLFNAIKYLLSLKNKKMIDDSGTIKIVSEEDSAYISKYYFTDSDIVEIQVEKSKFKYHNDITLYGNRHKAVRKSPREIKKRGKKSLNVFNEKFHFYKFYKLPYFSLYLINSSVLF